MEKYFVSRVQCADEWADSPTAFVLPFDPVVLERLNEYVQIAKSVKEKLPLFSMQFDGNTGYWLADENAMEKLGLTKYSERYGDGWFVRDSLDGIETENGQPKEFRIEMARCVVYPDGDLRWKCYMDDAPTMYWSEMVSLQNLIDSAK